MAVQPVAPVAFTIPDAVAYSGLSRSNLYRMIQRDDLPSLRVGGRRMIRRDALDAFFDRLTAEAEAA